MTNVKSTLLRLPNLRRWTVARHRPAQGAKDPGFIVLAGDRFGIPSDDTLQVMRAPRPSSLGEIGEAVGRMVQAEALPGLRDHADLDALITALRIPYASPGTEPGRAEELAVVHHVRGDDKEARNVLDILRSEHWPTGIPAIDGPQERFWLSLRERLGER